MSTIIGFNCGIHDSTVSLIQNNEVKAVYAEERFTCVKQQGGQINGALDNLIADFNIDLNLVNAFAASTSMIINRSNDIFDRYSDKVRVYPHHLCHALGSLWYSQFQEDVLVITLDAGDYNIHNFHYGDVLGDTHKNIANQTKPWHDRYKNVCHNVFGSVSTLRNGTFQIHNLFGPNFGNMYSMGCHSIYNKGIHGTNLEGKLMGLSSQGKYDEQLYKLFKSLCIFDPKTERFDCMSQMASTNNYLNGNLHHTIVDLASWNTDVRDVAYNVQRVLEEGICDLVRFYQNKFKCKKLCVAGGVFANVKVNQLLNEQFDFEEIFVMPAMSDEGIGFGAALCEIVNSQEYAVNTINDKHVVKSIKGIYDLKPLHDAYIGKGFRKDVVDALVAAHCTNYVPFDFDVLINELKAGKIVGVFRGRSEFGPRALGNRSILVDPTNRDTFTTLNNRLQRNEIMPFAPCILQERVEEVLHCNKSQRAAQYMTICYNVRDEWINKIPAVINIHDNTCRPQIVTESSNNWLHTVLSKYNAATGIPALLNTSFNTHGYPIINDPAQAVDALKAKVIDVLVLEDHIIYN